MNSAELRELAKGLTEAQRLRDLETALLAAVPPIEPPACHWLNSDASASYCWTCARDAAWNELPSVGPVPAETDWWDRDPIEGLIRDRIDGGFGGSESDHSEACEICGCTLAYLLTEYGQDEELAHYAENPIKPGDEIDGELTYALSRVFMNLDWEGADPAKTAAACIIAEDAIAAHILAQDKSQ